MCHQSVGLIARATEALGIATISLTSARSITRSANPPRALYLDFPLGRTAGKAFDAAMQLDIMRRALALLDTADRPGTIVDLPYRWADDDDWKDREMRPAPRETDNSAPSKHADDRVERFDTPQYQTDADAEAADPECATCVWVAAE